MPIREMLDRRTVSGEQRKRAEGKDREKRCKIGAVEVEAGV